MSDAKKGGRRTRRRRRKKRTRKRRKMRGGEEYTLDTLYDFLSENREEIGSLSIDVGPILAILEGFKERSEKGSYYIMNIEMNRADMINAEVVTKAIKKGFNGYASTSFEHQSMMRTLDETTLLKTFFTKDLPIIKAHYEFKPGAPGAVAAEASFNTAKEEKALAKEQKLAAKKAKDQQSGGRGKRTRKRRKSRRKRGGREVYESGIGQEGQAGVDEDCIDNGACKKGLQCIPGPTNTINARGTCKDLNVNEGGTRGKSRIKSRRGMRGKRKGKTRRKSRRKSRRRKRTRKRRRKNLKKQVGGVKFSEDMMDKIRSDEDIIKLKTKGYDKRCFNCRGATHVLIAKLREQGVDEEYIGWGEWDGHSVAIVKVGEGIQEKIEIDLKSPPDDIDNYYVFDGSFHQILKFEDVKSSENILFTGTLKDYYKHYSKSWRKDTKLTILPLALEVYRKWIVEEDYKWILEG